jgi:hypothetical protein
MQLPKTSKFFDTVLGTYWFDEYGILHLVMKNTPRTMENLQEEYTFIRKITGKKVCALMDVSERPAFEKETRDFVLGEMPKVYTAAAFISSSPLGDVIANIFCMLKPNSFPAKKCRSEEAAVSWLKQYL